jgi:hypothetical protein
MVEDNFQKGIKKGWWWLVRTFNLLQGPVGGFTASNVHAF